MKVNVKDLTQTFNELRQNNKGKTFLGSEFQKLMTKYGFNSYLISALRKGNTFNIIPSGASKLYSFKEEPLHITAMEYAVKEARAASQKYYTSKKAPKQEVVLTDEEKAVKLLKEQGYQLKKCVGFDEERFKKECPQLYAKYLTYESI